MKHSEWFLYTALATITVMMISGCADNRVSGTAGSETVNTFTVVVVDCEKKPVRGASVRVVADESWLRKSVNNESLTYYEAVSGHDGITRIPIDSLPGEDINLCIDSGFTGAFLPSYKFIDSSSGVQDTIFLRASSSLSGFVNYAGANPSGVSLQGTDYSSSIDPVTGEYSFPAVPPGNYNIVALSTDPQSQAARLAAAGNVELSEGVVSQADLMTDFSGILVDNFNGGADLMSYLNSGRWYIIKGGDISVNFPTAREADTLFIPSQSALVNSGAFEGKSLHVNYSAGTGTFYLIVGAQVSTIKAGFTNIDTVSFMAKGNGRLTLRLHGEQDVDKPQAFYYINLDTAWQSYSITFDQYEINDPDNSSAVWTDVEQRMTWLSFLPGGNGTDFWLDEIRLDGITINELLTPQ